jgi:hypothetical protein
MNEETLMRDNIDLKYFKKRLEQRLNEITDGHKTLSPLELEQCDCRSILRAHRPANPGKSQIVPYNRPLVDNGTILPQIRY